MDILEIALMSLIFGIFLFAGYAFYQMDIKRLLLLKQQCVETEGVVVGMEKDSEAEAFWLTIKFKTLSGDCITEKYYSAFETKSEFVTIGAQIPIFYHPDFPNLFVAAKSMAQFRKSMYFGIRVALLVFIALFISFHYFYLFISNAVSD
jgi:hypothetical protein